MIVQVSQGRRMRMALGNGEGMAQIVRVVPVFMMGQKGEDDADHINVAAPDEHKERENS
jgi:hypothetical protein